MLLNAAYYACLLAAGIPDAVRYLEAEVPKWKAENGCFSCHNNGDGARALLVAKGKADPATLAFLRAPDRWPADLAALALVQYALALERTKDASKTTLDAAAKLVAAAQKDDGHWEMDAEAASGSPVTYGPVLGTVLARDFLTRAEAQPAAAAKATAWLKARKAEHVVDISALVIAFRRIEDIERLRKL